MRPLFLSPSYSKKGDLGIARPVFCSMFVRHSIQWILTECSHRLAGTKHIITADLPIFFSPDRSNSYTFQQAGSAQYLIT